MKMLLVTPCVSGELTPWRGDPDFLFSVHI